MLTEDRFYGSINAHITPPKYKGLPAHINHSRMVCPVCSTKGAVSHICMNGKDHICNKCSFQGHAQDFIFAIAAAALEAKMKQVASA